MKRKNRIVPECSIKEELLAPTSFLLYCVTWNLGGTLPSLLDLEHLLPSGYEVYVIATQECGQSISSSFVSKPIVSKWSALLMEYFDEKFGAHSFELVEHESLVAINMIIIARKRTVSPHLYNIESESIATGAVGGLLGNKGGVAISFEYNKLFSFLFINSHFHAHQNNTIVRHEDYLSINKNLKLGLHRSRNHEHMHGVEEKRASSRFQFVVWMGDLNYRINGNRKIMDLLLRKKEFAIMLQNDQLNIARNYRQIFDDGFVESKIRFAPTYKYDVKCDEYDTSSKARIPSWTDRILYKASSECSECIRNLQYDSISSLKLSDHRPVFASFKIDLSAHSNSSSTSSNSPRAIEMEMNVKYPRYRNSSKSSVLLQTVSRYYKLMCFCFCFVCMKSRCWRALFCARSNRVRVRHKFD